MNQIRHIEMVFLILVLIMTLCGCADKSARNERCLEDLLNIQTNVKFSSSSAQDNFQPNMSRLHSVMDNQRPHEAWCPAKPVGDHMTEWLEIDFTSLHVVTTILTVGRRQGNNAFYVSAYILKYQRENNGPWFNYSMMNGTQILSANSDSMNHARKTLDIPIIAKRIRIIPYHKSPIIRDICLKLKIFGCPFKDGIVEYKTPTGFIDENFQFIDRGYDNASNCLTENYLPKINCWLTGGMGILMDDEIHLGALTLDTSPSLPFPPVHYVGWKRAIHSQGVPIVLRFFDVHEIHSIRLFMTNHPELGVGFYSELIARIAMNEDVCSNPGNMYNMSAQGVANIIDIQTLDDRFARSKWINVTFKKDSQQQEGYLLSMGKILCLQLTHQRDIMAISEIIVNATHVELSEEEKNQLINEEMEIEQIRKRKWHSNGNEKSSADTKLSLTTKSTILLENNSFFTFSFSWIILIFLIITIMLLLCSGIMCIVLRHRHLRLCCPCRCCKRCSWFRPSGNCPHTSNHHLHHKRAVALSDNNNKNLDSDLLHHHHQQQQQQQQQQHKQWIDYIPAYPSLARRTPVHNNNPLHYIYPTNTTGGTIGPGGVGGINNGGPASQAYMNGYQPIPVSPFHHPHNWSAAPQSYETSHLHYQNTALFPRSPGNGASESSPFLSSGGGGVGGIYNMTGCPLTDDTGSQIYEQAGNPSPIVGGGVAASAAGGGGTGGQGGGGGATLSNGTRSSLSSHTTSSTENGFEGNRKTKENVSRSPWANGRNKHETGMTISSQQDDGSPSIQLPPLPPNHPSLQGGGGVPPQMMVSPYLVHSIKSSPAHPVMVPTTTTTTTSQRQGFPY